MNIEYEDIFKEDVSRLKEISKEFIEIELVKNELVIPEGTGVGACQNELWINPSVFTISEGNYVMKPAEDVDECPRTYDMMEFAGF